MNMRKFLIRNIKKARDQIDGKLIITPKSKDGDLVTNFDTKVEKFLIKKFKRTYPDFDIISEELNSDKKITKNCFIIDPIDGTNNFARKIPIWGMQVACIKDGKIIASVVYLPIYEELYSADESGAYLNDEEIYVNKQNEKIGVYSVSPRTKNLDEIQSKNPNSRNFGSAAFSFAMLACGKISAVFVLRDSKPWDIIPGEYLAKQAGAITFNTGENRITANSKSWNNLLTAGPTQEEQKPKAPAEKPQEPASTVFPPPPFSPVPKTKLFEIKDTTPNSPTKARPTAPKTPLIPPKPILKAPPQKPSTNRPPLFTPKPEINILKTTPRPPKQPNQATIPHSSIPNIPPKIANFSIEESETIIETFSTPIPPKITPKTKITPSLTEARKKKIIM